MRVPFGRLTETDSVVRAMMLLMIKQHAVEQNFPEHRLKAMQFQAQCHYDISRMETVLNVGWMDPEGDYRRGFWLRLIDRNGDVALRDPDRLYEELKMSIEQINLRGELFYFKLHRHFPNRIENVKCRADRTVTVTFKNGRSLTVDDAEIGSTEFLATCGMIYDL
jgi:hypothetical protein